LSSGNTEKILSTLKSKGVEATFHICAQFLPGTRDLVRKIVRDGHLLGMRFNPLITDLRGLSEAQLHKQLKNDQAIIYDNTGVRVKFLRLPFNGYGDRELKIIESMGFIVTEHNLESYDFQEGKIMSAFKTKLNECKAYGCSGIISVQREASNETTKRLPAIIDMIDDVGYNFVKLDKCIRGVN
jgi:peptidoglycan/xylan/chitin deacetylase (PgdA/CDA1 family)